MDSVNLLDALLGESAAGRTELVTEGIQAQRLLRIKEWAFLPATDGPRDSGTTGNETGFSHWDQLCRLTANIGQRQNVASEHPDVVERLRTRLEEIVGSSRTRP